MPTPAPTPAKIDLAQFLNQQYLCECLTVREVETLIEFTDSVVYRKNTIIADIGEVGEALYFVIQGEASLTYDVEGQTIELASAREGELIGEMSFFDREPRSVRMVATASGTQLLRLSRVMYERLRVQHPFIAVNLLEHAIVSLDHLFRLVSQDAATFSHYLKERDRSKS